MSSIWGELRRRNVFKIGAAYAIVAWLCMEVSSVAVPALRLPEWTVTLITFLVLLGFPIALVLAWAYDMTPEGIKAAADVRPAASTSRTGQSFNYFLLGLIVPTLAFLVLDRFVLEPRTGSATLTMDSPGVKRFVTRLSFREPVGDTGLSAHLALSPDGTGLVTVAQTDGNSQLYFRTLDQLEAHPMPGTDGAHNPFFSPDGEWVGFYSDQTDQKLKKVSVRGGLPQTLADAPFASGGSWVTDDTIVYSTQQPAGGRGLFRITATGGTPELLLGSDSERGYVTPEVLPGGEAVLYVERPGDGGAGNARDGSIGVLTLATGETRSLIEGAFRPQYAPTGHIVFMRAGGLWAVPFDAQRLETTGPEVPLIDAVQADGFRGIVPYAFSKNGMLVYVPGADTLTGPGNDRSLVWVDRDGREEPAVAELREYFNPRLSPDGQRLAVTIQEGGNQDVWIYDLSRGTSNRLTFHPGTDQHPVWTPDGQSVVYYSAERGLLRRAANGSGEAEPLTGSPPANQLPESVTPDGSRLLFRQSDAIHSMSMDGESESARLFDVPYLSGFSEVSPDGRFIAYSAFATGRAEVYVRPFPNVHDGKWQVSIDGGIEALWGPEGNELFFLRGGEAAPLMVARIDTESISPVLGRPQVLFEASFASNFDSIPNYDISPDGRFLMMKQTVTPVQDEKELIFVDSWFAELTRLAPPSP